MAAMITFPTKLTLTIFMLLLINLVPIINSHPFSRRLSRKDSGWGMVPTKTELQFYFHDIPVGSVLHVNSTAVPIADAGATTRASRTAFGLLMMIDDPLTEGPELTSKQVGRAQGVYGSAGQNSLALLMTLNFVFTDGDFKGSTLSLLGRNAAVEPVREMPIVGGTDLFRFAQGYAQAKTHSLDFKTGNAVVQYTVTVFHFM